MVEIMDAVEAGFKMLGLTLNQKEYLLMNVNHTHQEVVLPENAHKHAQMDQLQ